MGEFKRCCANCICSRVSYGFRTGWKYLYCMLDEPSFWRGGKEVLSNHVCKYWRDHRLSDRRRENRPE